MPLHIEDAQTVNDLVAVQDLQRHDERFSDQVRINGGVEHVYGPIVCRSAEKRMAVVKLERSNRFSVVTQRSVGPVRQVKVVPDNTLVVAAH